ncbi:MAG: putative metal-binding motif-containing protein [Myxococcota bacterium]
MRSMVYGIALGCLACSGGTDPFAPTLDLPATPIDLGAITLETPPVPTSFRVTNSGGTLMFLTASFPVADSGTPAEAADLVSVDIAPYTPIYPGQTELFPIEVDPRQWRWQTMDAAVVRVPLELRYYFGGQASDEPEPFSKDGPTAEFSLGEVAVQFSINCDLDGDGFDSQACAGLDCDDEDPTVNPNGVEVCDGIDQDCDGARDEQAKDRVLWYPDDDFDGYGDETSSSVLTCYSPNGSWVTNDLDCDDSDMDTRPLGFEICNDGIDNDCDDLTDGQDDDCS